MARGNIVRSVPGRTPIRDARDPKQAQPGARAMMGVPVVSYSNGKEAGGKEGQRVTGSK